MVKAKKKVTSKSQTRSAPAKAAQTKPVQAKEAPVTPIRPQKYFDEEVVDVAQKQTPKISAFSAVLIIVVIIVFIIIIARIFVSRDGANLAVANTTANASSVVPQVIPNTTAPEKNVSEPTQAVFEPIAGEESCKDITSSYKITCDSQYAPYNCSLASDGNLSTEWIAAYSCTSGRSPCAVGNWIKIEKIDPSAPDVAQIHFYNRLSPDFYVNRAILAYNGGKQTVIGGKFLKPWLINLTNTSSNITMSIVEIVGSGSSYLAGSAEVQLFGTCST